MLETKLRNENFTNFTILASSVLYQKNILLTTEKFVSVKTELDRNFYSVVAGGMSELFS